MKTFEEFVQSEPVINYYNNGNISMKIWYDKDGYKHKEDGPAKIVYDININGKIKIETWYKNDKKHREDGPAIIVYDKNGKIKKIYWYKDNLRHREDGPAYVDLSDILGKGNREEYWYKYGKIHREDGPAHISYEKDKIMYSVYYLYDYNCTFEEWLDKLKDINPEEYKIQKQKKEFKDLGI